jgi:hypothetical protein
MRNITFYVWFCGIVMCVLLLQYYYQHNRAPKTDHYVIPFTPDLVRPPSKQPKELLPEIWREYVYPDGTKSHDATSFLLLHS